MTVIPVVDPYYRVEVDAGPYSWTTTKGDAAGYGLADPLRVSWSRPNKPLFNVQPDPMSASFSVVVASMADVSQLVRGVTVDLRVYGWPPGTANPHVEAGDLDPVNYPPIVLFRGRVSDVVAVPHELGMIVTASCVDYSVDLAELSIGADDWPAEDVSDRLGRMFDEAGVLPPNEAFPGSYFFVGFIMAARAGSPQPARSLIWSCVEQTTANSDDPFGIAAVIRPHYAAGDLAGTTPDPLQPYELNAAVSNRVPSGNTGAAKRLPGSLVLTSPGKYGVDVVETAQRRAAVIPAEHVDFSAKWSQTKRTAPDTITVTGTFISGEKRLTVAAPDAVPVGATIAVDIADDTVAIGYAQANLASEDSDHWVADSFVWYADQDPWPMIADELWFIEGRHVTASRAPVVVDGIPEHQNPTGLDWYAGRLKGATFTLAGGRYSVAVQLLRSLLRPGHYDASIPGENVGTLAWNDLVGVPYAAIGWDDLDVAFSWFDYRLVRSP